MHHNRHLLEQHAHDSTFAWVWALSLKPDAAIQSTGRFTVLN
jgi:hypothetical protein